MTPNPEGTEILAHDETLAELSDAENEGAEEQKEDFQSVNSGGGDDVFTWQDKQSSSLSS